MPGFKDQTALDRAVFLNLDEFADLVPIKYGSGPAENIPIVIDNDRLKERSKKEFDGLVIGDLLYFAKTESFSRKPKPDDVQVFAGKKYMVFDVREDDGILEIILKGAES